jgi:hypothetical protein
VILAAGSLGVEPERLPLTGRRETLNVLARRTKSPPDREIGNSRVASRQSPVPSRESLGENEDGRHETPISAFPPLFREICPWRHRPSGHGNATSGGAINGESSSVRGSNIGMASYVNTTKSFPEALDRTLGVLGRCPHDSDFHPDL